jgi:hypothetical protein
MKEVCAQFLAPADKSGAARWANRALLAGLALFAVSVPHSVAAAQISLALCAVAWAARDVSLRRFHFARTPLDLPLAGFAALTVISAVASTEPGLSLPKLRALLLFLVIYLCATNLRPRGVKLLVALMTLSALVGVGFSLAEKVKGRGMTVTAISADSPLSASRLQAGDVIWMVARRRVSSPDEAAGVIRRRRAGERVEIEALHAGDPLPVEIIVTDELKAKANPLGVSGGGPSRRFRVSGFTRHFLTYAEQMQVFALLAFGAFIAALRRPSRSLSISLFLSFALALVLTASRAVIASFLGALLAVSGLLANRRVALGALGAALALALGGVYVLHATRTAGAVNFSDDSAARRVSYMKAGLRLIPRHPLLGVGMDAHKRHWKEWGFPGEYVTHTHSTPIQIAMERGLPALFFYAWLMAAMGVIAWRAYQRTRDGGGEFDWLALGTFAALVGFVASSLVNYNFGDSEVVMLLFAFVGAVIAAERNGQISPDAAAR